MTPPRPLPSRSIEFTRIAGRLLESRSIRLLKWRILRFCTFRMTSVLIQMSLLIVLGVAWRIIRPGGLDADHARGVLTTLVFYFLLPALVLSVLWEVELSLMTVRIAVFGAGIILFGALLSWLLLRGWQVPPQRRGAVLLSVAFPNVTYLGLPVLEHTFGSWTRALVIQLDLFAATPLVLTFGVLIARHYGEGNSHISIGRSLLVNPPLWAALIAVLLNLSGVAPTTAIRAFLTPLSCAVVPLMLLALGLGLRWDTWKWRTTPLASLVLVLKLLLMPLFGIGLAKWLGFRGDTLRALVLEAGMPSMLLGVVYCDRYHLDSSFYAMLVTLTTLFALISLPYWHSWPVPVSMAPPW